VEYAPEQVVTPPVPEMWHPSRGAMGHTDLVLDAESPPSEDRHVSRAQHPPMLEPDDPDVPF
jgi:hypothetical protein